MPLWAFLQSAQNNGGGPATSVSANSFTNVAQNCLVAFVVWTGSFTCSITDTRNTWQAATTRLLVTGTTFCQVFFTPNAGAGANVVKATFSGSATNFAICVSEYTTPTGTVPAVTASGSATGTGTALNSGASSSVTLANTLVVACMAASTNFTTGMTVGSGYTFRAFISSGNLYTEDNLNSGYSPSGITATASSTTPTSWICVIVAFTPGSNPGAVNEIPTPNPCAIRTQPCALSQGNILPRTGQILPSGWFNNV